MNTTTRLVLCLAAAFALMSPVVSQDSGCGALPTRLSPGARGQVMFVNSLPLNVREAAGLNENRAGQLPEGTAFTVLDGPTCADDLYWWRIQAGDVTGWIAESFEGEYLVGPLGPAFAAWDWAAFLGPYDDAPDPLTISPPSRYAGDLPGLPVDLAAVGFLEEASLDADQKALLSQNGFVVTPAGLEQFHEAFSGERPNFVTTDSMLHALHYIFSNLLSDLEKEVFYDEVSRIVSSSLQAAHTQAGALAGTPLQEAARDAELYLAVALELLSPGSLEALVAEDVAREAQQIAVMALAGEGQLLVPFLEGYVEDFSQYRPRGHYAGDEVLERYFRGMMWLSRITFRAKSDPETQTALLLLRALQTAPDAYPSWQTLDETLSFLVGPVDDLGPREYAKLADAVFGGESALTDLGDLEKLAAFRGQVAQLPGPRVNGLILPVGTKAGEEVELTRGFRFLGQRFTFDAYIMQQLMFAYVGTFENPRSLPLGLDIPAVMGSETAYHLADEAGAVAYANYDTQIAKLRAENAALSDENWMENFYGGWLWSLQPLWLRDPNPYPPLMQTDAWLRRDLQAGLASWTELKHDTVLYAKQATGFGGGGPPLLAYGYIEPNPLVFARIAIVAATLHQGLVERGLATEDSASARFATLWELRALAVRAAQFAEMARKELVGEPLTDDDYYDIQTYGERYLYELLYKLYQGEDQPDPVALVTDVANDGLALVLQEGVGGVDYIYVVIPGPEGLQLARGGVFSYYEFVGDMNKRMTDQEWRALVASDQLPPRPAWVSSFTSD